MIKMVSAQTIMAPIPTDLTRLDRSKLLKVDLNDQTLTSGQGWGYDKGSVRVRDGTHFDGPDFDKEP
jgi:hypothetical protein